MVDSNRHDLDMKPLPFISRQTLSFPQCPQVPSLAIASHPQALSLITYPKSVIAPNPACDTEVITVEPVCIRPKLSPG